MDWSDRPIQSGDLFEPTGPCQVRSETSTWLFEPHGSGGGSWTRIPRDQSTPRGRAEAARAVWYLYDWVVWHEEGSVYRLRIGVGQMSGHLTGPIESVDGDFR